MVVGWVITFMAFSQTFSARLKRGLYAGASLSVLALVLGAGAAALAQSPTSVVRQVSAGQDGNPWVSYFGSIAAPSTAGQAAGDVSFVNSTIVEGASTTAVEVGSRGGNGQRGEPGGVGKAGGNAGTVFFQQLAQASGSGVQASPTSLVSVYSTGGWGGVGQAGLGRGGSAGRISAVLDASIATQGDNFTGLWVRSQGGQTGNNLPDVVVTSAGPIPFGFSTASLAQPWKSANGGQVDLNTSTKSVVSTQGARAFGIVVESVGGAGLDGGARLYHYLSPGGDGSRATAIVAGTVKTDGREAAGVLVQSVGGNGGTGTNDTGVRGGAGGNGGRVSAFQNGRIETRQDYSIGLIAQSLGGIGGAGGFGFETNAGDGGASGNGGRVEVFNAGPIETSGRGSIGIAALSLGGGASTGAVQYGDLSTSGTKRSNAGGFSGGGLFSWSGGRGGSGGDGGEVELTNNGTVLTRGEAAFGILAQSVGGGGGAGGGAGSALNILLGAPSGGAGGAGGNGGSVTLKATSKINTFVRTEGKGSSAILAQSIGGGGGAGGDAKAVSTGSVITVTMGIGGQGGDGGSGGGVTVGNASTLSTTGLSANGIEAASIGGGGGKGGSIASYAVSAAPPGVPNFNFTKVVGGAGGKGGSGAEVKVTNGAAITTAGDESIGILATSIGGGGGGGGTAASLNDMLGLYANFALNLSHGGTGGSGGNGGSVGVTNAATIHTTGAFSTGIQAASIGGGGGNGGSASAKTSKGITTNDTLKTLSDAIPIGGTFSLNYSAGGKAGGGGSGSAASAINSGTIRTEGSDAKGLVVQSVGGGGGNGGGYLAGGSGKLNVSLGLGGSGGDGGAGGSASASNALYGLIATKGDGAIGMHVQSIGGGGGTGGAFSNPDAKPPVKTADNTLTKAGGVITTAAGVLLKLNDLVQPLFKDKIPFFAEDGTAQQRVAYAGQFLAGLKEALQSVREDRALANERDRLTSEGKPLPPDMPGADRLTQSAIIYNAIYRGATTTTMSLLMDSITSRMKDALTEVILVKKLSLLPFDLTIEAQVGGVGGKGGAGEAVKGDNAGAIMTQGHAAPAMLAQSIGGGGGVAGAASTFGPSKIDVRAYLGNRSSGASGKGDEVTLTNSAYGSISTLGNASFGMVGQSIGGGGGVLGVTVNGATLGDATANVSLGAKITGTANGSLVKITNAGRITTQGKEAHGIVAQSIGGGGGLYVINRKNPLDPEMFGSTPVEVQALKDLNDVAQYLNVDAEKKRQDAVKGLIAPVSLTAQFGGIKGAGADFPGGNGGTVTLEHSGDIRTSGSGAIGIVGQSIGGGGGLGADASTLGEPVHYALTMGSEPVKAGSENSPLKGSGDGGEIALTLSANASISTSGNGAHGALLQSIGGGGGYGGAGTGSFKVSSLASRSRNDIFELGLFEMASYGNGGDIKVHMGPAAGAGGGMSIHTSGERANGLFIQSLTGGGGAAFDLNGSTVDPITNAASRPVFYDFGFFPPFGAPGQNQYYDLRRVTLLPGEMMTGHAGKVEIDTQGEIVATGSGSYGIFVQNGRQKEDGSIDPYQPFWSGDVSIAHQGTIWGGKGKGAGIRIDGAGTNGITIKPDSKLGAESGVALLSRLGNTSLTNQGTVIGDVLASSNGQNKFANTGTYQSRESQGLVALGSKPSAPNVNAPAGSLFENSGIIDIGGVGRLATLGIEADRTRLGGTLLVDVRNLGSKAESDVLSTLKSTSLDHLTIKPYAKDGLLKGLYGVVKGPEFDADPSVKVASFGPISWTVMPSPGVTLMPSADFTMGVPGAWNDNEKAMISAWQTAWDAGNAAEAPVFAQAANVQNFQDYQNLVDSGSTDGHQAIAAVQTEQVWNSLTGALSCPIFIESGITLGESQCAWAKVTGSYDRQYENAASDGFTKRAMTFRLGAQREIAKDWFVGLTGAYTSSDFSSSDGFTDGEGNSGDLSASLKHQMGPLLLAASAHVGFGVFDTTQQIDLPTGQWLLSNDTQIWTGALRLRAAYEFGFPEEGTYLRPYVDLDAIYTHVPGFTTDGGSAWIDVESMNEWTLDVTPAVEFGARIDLDEDTWLRPYATVGATFLANDALGARVSFSSAAGEGMDFTSQSDLPDVLANLGAGLQLYAQDKYELRGEYRAQIGEDFLGQEASMRFSVSF